MGRKFLWTVLKIRWNRKDQETLNKPKAPKPTKRLSLAAMTVTLLVGLITMPPAVGWGDEYPVVRRAIPVVIAGLGIANIIVMKNWTDCIEPLEAAFQVGINCGDCYKVPLKIGPGSACCNQTNSGWWNQCPTDSTYCQDTATLLRCYVAGPM